MENIVSGYERNITEIIAEQDNEKKAHQEDIAELMRERDQAYVDTQSVESAFADLHRRYEKTKPVIQSFKKNEDTLKACVNAYREKLNQQDERYQTLKKYAEEKLAKSTEELERLKRSTDGELEKLQAALRKKELQVNTSDLTNTVELADGRECRRYVDHPRGLV